jgi:thioredoxin-disulfide reductase
VAQSEKIGAWPGLVVTAASLRSFFTEVDGAKVGEAAELATKYEGKTALLMRRLNKLYSKMPIATKSEDSEAERVNDTVQTDVKKMPDVKKPEARKPEEEAEEEDSGALLISEEDFVIGAEAEKVVIIGGGPAGLAAAIYAARSGLTPLIIAPMGGGQLLGKGADVENYPGVSGAKGTGRGIVGLMRYQVADFEGRMLDAFIESLDLSQRPFKLTLNHSKKVLFTHSIVMATGADSRWLGIPGEAELQGFGVSSCATCDGFLFKGKAAVVVGGGDSAMEDALVLARTSSSVDVVHRRGYFTATHVLKERVLKHPKITVHYDTEVARFHSAGKGDSKEMTGVEVRNKLTGETKVLPAGAAFVAIGHEPNTQLMKSWADMDADGYLLVKDRSTHTSIDGVFAAGDVADKVYRQAVTSAGTGAAAALDAERWLSAQGLGVS